jgi:para-aminobenzoate synthetase / 4-amino-4-deoxychorismate lyase
VVVTGTPRCFPLPFPLGPSPSCPIGGHHLPSTIHGLCSNPSGSAAHRRALPHCDARRLMLPLDSVLLDTARPGPDDPAGALLFTRPLRVLVATTFGEVAPLLEELEEASAGGHHCAGYLAYEAGYALDPTGFPDPPPPDSPLAWFGVYDAPERLPPEEIERFLKRGGEGRALRPRFELSRDAYRDRIAAIKHHIREGDVYQINFTAPIHFRFEGDPLGLYRDLRRKQPVPYGAVVRTADRWVLSLSPELFVRRDGDRLTARPMKGTVRRGPDPTSDAERAAWLTSDEKNRAENLMIVDLLRNDLSMVAEPGSVHVPALFTAERYDTLWQMTSTVVATTDPGTGVASVLRALFPCGSVTGAPKRRAMQIIREIEDGPRGVYCGALGVVEPGGAFAFSVPIRTVEIGGQQGRLGVGSGVVWDSDADAEYDECLLKGRFLTDPPPPDFELLETMRAEDGGVPLLDLHLARLRASAEYFGYPDDEQAIRATVAEAVRGSGPLRLRLTLDRSGRVQVEHRALDDPPLRRVIVFPEPVPDDDPFLRHKTTHRPLYERAMAWARERGADEAILLNRRGEVTEGTITNVWIRRGGQLLTAPTASGGLAGVYRAHLLATTPSALVATISVEDLRGADAVLLSNAVRGLQEVELSR